MLASCNAGEKDFALGDPGRGDLGMACFKLGLHRVEYVIFDKARDFDGDPFLPCLRLAAATVAPVEVMDAGVAHAGQHLVDELDAERFAAALGKAMSVQIGGDVLDPERAGLPVAEEIELEDEPDDVRFLRQERP